MRASTSLWPLVQSGLLGVILATSVGCASGPNQDTLVDELRVLATLATTPEAQPGERVGLQTLVVDPEQRGFDLLLWSCTFAGEQCVESLIGEGEPWAGAIVAEGSGETSGLFSSELDVNRQLEAFVGDEPLPILQTWALACEPGLCPAIELARAAPAPGTDEAKRLVKLLSDPFGMLEDLPLTGVSLGLRSLSVSTRAPADRAQNPTLSLTGPGGAALPAEVAPEGEVDVLLTFEGARDDDRAVWLYTDAGGFLDASVGAPDADDVARSTYFAPAKPKEQVNLWFIGVDGLGGVAMLSHQLAVTGG